MSKMLVKYLTPGTTLLRPIKSTEGDILFDGGHSLSKEDIDTLVNQRIVVVFVEKEDLFALRGGHLKDDKERLLNELQYKNPLIEDIPIVVSEETQKAAIEAVHHVIGDMHSGNPIDSEQSQNVVDNMVSEMMANRGAMINLIDIRTFDDYTFSHSVNVCVLCVLIAIEMNLPEKVIREFGVGALLHDLGKVKIQDEILNKNGALTDEEFLEMKMHPTFSRELLLTDSKISEQSINIAHQHHEKVNGQGYPQGLVGEQIDIFARIAAIADVYDALTSDRIYRPKMEPYKAIKIILSGNGTHFDPKIVNVFVRHMSVYPVESIVRLSDGHIAIVIKANHNTSIAPQVRLISDANGNKISGKEEVDLCHDPRFISGVLSENDLAALGVSP